MKRAIDRFHMTLRRPYWCTKTKEWRPYWCTRLTLWELNSIFMQILSFVSLNQYGHWSREWKRSIASNFGWFDSLHCFGLLWLGEVIASVLNWKPLYKCQITKCFRYFITPYFCQFSVLEKKRMKEWLPDLQLWIHHMKTFYKRGINKN